jgi:hypothetical protein
MTKCELRGNRRGRALSHRIGPRPYDPLRV